MPRLRFDFLRPFEQFVLSNFKRTTVVGQRHLGIESTVVELFISGGFPLIFFLQLVQLCLERLYIDSRDVEPLLKVVSFLKRSIELAIASIQSRF